MTSQNPDGPKTTETGEGGGYGGPTPEQELGGKQAPAPQERNGTPDQKASDQEAPGHEDLAGEQQDPVTGEPLGPGEAESPA